jgi:uncharacterized protein YeaO (DUF488 family)
MRPPEERDVPTIQLKRIYEPGDARDGLRVLVDRLWPRGMSKTQAHLDAWMKDLGPSEELRQWFGHRAERWTDFQKRYRRELSAPLRQLFLALLQSAARTSTVTLLYGARDRHQNEAVVLRDYLLDQRAPRGRTDQNTLALVAAVAAVAAAQPSGEAPASRLRPFLDLFHSGQQLEALLQTLRDRGEMQEGHNGWRLTSRGERLLRDVPTVPAE